MDFIEFYWNFDKLSGDSCKLTRAACPVQEFEEKELAMQEELNKRAEVEKKVIQEMERKRKEVGRCLCNRNADKSAPKLCALCFEL